MVSRVKAKYWRTTHKFGIQVPKKVDEAYKIDQQTGNTFWEKQLKGKWLTSGLFQGFKGSDTISD